MKSGEKRKRRTPSWGGEGEREKETGGWSGRGQRQTRTPNGGFRRKKGITRWREACVCVVAAARAGEGVPSCVSSGGGRPVTPGEGGAHRAGRRHRGLGQAAAHAAQSPGVARRSRGETYTGPPGPAQRRRRGLRTAPPPPRALAVRPASLQVTLAAGEKLQEEGSVRMEGFAPVVPECEDPLPPPSLCLNPETLGNLGGVVGAAGSGRYAEKGGDPEPQTQPCRRPGTA